MKNRMVALLLCGIMTVSTLAGCGSTDTSNESQEKDSTIESTTESSAQKSDEQKESAAEPEEFDPRSITEGVKLTIAIPMNPNISDYEENEMTWAIEERLGVDLEFVVYPAETFNEKINVMINGGDELPDIILGAKGNHEEWGETGAIVDLAEYLENPDYAEHMYSMMDATGVDIVELAKTFDGKIWGYPTYYTDLEGTVCWNLLVNKKYAEAVGFDEIPTTTEGFLELCRAFKAAGDVNGNGEDDEVVMSGSSALYWFKCLMSSYVYAWGNNYLINEDGELQFAYTTDEWKEGLKYLHTFFDEGLIDTGALTNDDKAWEAITYDSDVRVLADVRYWVLCKNEDGTLNYEKMLDWEKPIMLTSPVNDEVYSYHNPQVPSFRSFITTDCENPLAAFLVLDLVASHDEFTRINRTGGEKGLTWNYWDEVPDEWFAEKGVSKDQYQVVEGETGLHFIWEHGLATPSSEPHNRSWGGKGPIHYNDVGFSKVYDATNPDNAAYAIKRAQAHEVADDKYLPGDLLVTAHQVQMTAEETEQYADINAALASYVKESIGSFLLGEWDIEKDWDTYLSELKKIGIDDSLEMYQKAYDRMNK